MPSQGKGFFPGIASFLKQAKRFKSFRSHRLQPATSLSTYLMTSLYIASKFAKLSTKSPEGAKLLLRLDEAEKGQDVLDALEKYDLATRN